MLFTNAGSLTVPSASSHAHTLAMKGICYDDVDFVDFFVHLGWGTRPEDLIHWTPSDTRTFVVFFFFSFFLI